MKNFSLVGLCTLALLAVAKVEAQWVLIEDFECLMEGSYTPGGSPDLVYPGSSLGGLGQMDIVADVEGINGFSAAWFWHGETLSEPGEFWHQIPLPQPIPHGETGTLYWRMWQGGSDLNWHVMLSKVAAGEEPDDVGAWGNQAAILRFKADHSLALQAHSGSSYVSSELEPEPGEWYEFFMVINNDGADGYYEIYRRGPNDVQPQVVEFDIGGVPTLQLPVRNKDEGPIQTLVLAQTGQNGDDMWLIDDIYMMEGQSLSNHVAPPDWQERWAEWTDDLADNWIDTGEDFLGWIYVGEDGWIAPQKLGKWIYLPEKWVTRCFQPGGAMAYIPRE